MLSSGEGREPVRARLSPPTSPTGTLAYAEPAARMSRIPLPLVAGLSMAIACVGLIINAAITKTFLTKLPRAMSEVKQIDGAAATEAAAEKAEAAAEERARANLPRGLTAAEAADVVDDAEFLCGRLTNPERKTFTSLLRADGQRIIDPSIPVETRHLFSGERMEFEKPRQQLLTARMLRKSVVWIRVFHRQTVTDHPTFSTLNIDRDGKWVYADIDSPTGHEWGVLQERTQHELSSWSLSPSSGAGQAKAHATLDSSRMVVAAGVIAAALSALLFLAGVLLLFKHTSLGIRLHRLYAGSKLAVSLLSMFVFAAAASGDTPDPLFSRGMMAAAAVLFAAAGCIYPIFLLLTLQADAGRDGSILPERAIQKRAKGPV